MGSLRCLGFVVGVVLMMICLGSTEAREFYVGGRDGWVLKPSEGYSHWANRERFQVNDTLIFKFKPDSDSVLVVDKNSYYKCNKENPIQTLANGDFTFKFEHSGQFFFISGEGDNCLKGQKLEIIVLALTHHQHHSNHTAGSTKSPSIAKSPEQHWNNVLAPAPAPSAAAPSSLASSCAGFLLGLSVISMISWVF